MLKRAIPLLLLLGLGGVGAHHIWRSNEPSRRFARIDDLLRAYQGKPHGAWTKEDRAELWSQVTWFHRRDRDGFTRRVVAGIASDDPDERCQSALLAAHVDSYEALNHGLNVSVTPWVLPLPDPRVDRLSDFKFRDFPRRHPEAFARLADDPNEDVRLALVFLAEAADAPELREAFIRIVTRETSFEEKFWAIRSLGFEEHPDSARALAALTGTGELRTRFMAATALAGLGDPAGSRLFINLLTDVENDLSRHERSVGYSFLTGRFNSLEPLREETSWAMDQRPDLLENAFRHWRSWLEIREHEGFRADAQAARDQAWTEAHP